jgi:predicted pyridoxine 5'-phosphate oxidase superfamily flavin-nucleotide-binding protein
MNATANVGELAFFTPAVKATLERFGSGKSCARLEGRSITTQIGPEEAAFIAARNSFYVASIGENSWPFTQYRRGAKGFLRTLDRTTLGFADSRVNRQYISTGKVLLFLMDYPSQRRLKIWAETEISEDPAMIEKLTETSYGAEIDRAFLFHVLAFEWNCQRRVVQRYPPEEYPACSASEQSQPLCV